MDNEKTKFITISAKNSETVEFRKFKSIEGNDAVYDEKGSFSKQLSTNCGVFVFDIKKNEKLMVIVTPQYGCNFLNTKDNSVNTSVEIENQNDFNKLLFKNKNKLLSSDKEDILFFKGDEKSKIKLTLSEIPCDKIEQINSLIETFKNFTGCNLSNINENNEITITPFAFDVAGLFEFIARKRIREIINNRLDKTDWEVLDGNLNPHNTLIEETKEENKKENKKEFHNKFHISGDVKPDIIIHNKKTDKYIIIDAKYKSPDKNDRDDRLQILAYAYLYDAHIVGHIFPAPAKSSKNKDDYDLKFHKLNTSLGDYNYVQLYLDDENLTANIKEMNNMEINDFTKSKIKEICSNIENTNRFILLRGSIGVGKTLIAKILSKMIIDKDYNYKNIEPNNKKWEELVNFSGTDCNKKWNAQVKIVPFHPGSDYENLIYGLKLTTENGNMKYNATERILLNVILKAKKDSNNNYVVILDDVNRGNFSRAMGDILSAVESKDIGNAVRTPEESYTIPDNFYLIATFNPTIGNPNIDYAWLRRFMIFDIFSDERYIEDVNKIIERNKCENFFSETDKEKFTDYIYELYMQIKILFERYFLDDDVNIIKQYMPGHGLFMTYDDYDNKAYEKNAKKFSYQLKHCIVPLLYQYVKDGLLDKRALFDIEAFEHLYDHDFKYWENANDDSLKNFKADGKIKPLLFVCLKNLMGLSNPTLKTIPQAASFRFLLQNVSVMRKKDNNFYYLFDTPEIAEQANNLYINKSISLGGFDYRIPNKLSLSYENITDTSALDKSYQFYNREMLVDYIVFRLIKVYLRVKEFDCYVNDDIYEINIDDIISKMNDYLSFFSNNINKGPYNEKIDERKSRLTEIADSVIRCHDNKSIPKSDLN